MPPAKKAKKVIHQDELRRLMREKQRQSTDKKKVESPYAKYNSLGHLSCALCNAQVKSELLWQTHVLGKQHREKVAEVKASAHMPPPPPPPPQQHLPLKRKTQELEDGRGKAAKSSRGDSDLFKKPSARLTPPTQKKSAGLSLLAGVYDDDDEEEDDEGDGDERGKTGAEDEAGDLGAPAAGLPDDFFDSAIPAAPAVSHSGSVLKADAAAAERSGGPRRGNAAANASAEALPEGFFDDPVRDAKVRNVEAPQDLMDKEWDEFQREIRQVNTKSDAIVAEDDEEGRIGRQIGEIDEQIACYRRVEVLRDRREVARRGSVRDGGREEDGEDEVEVNDTNIEEDEELLGLLSRDWRAKGALA